MKQVKLLYRKKKSMLSIFGLSVQKEVLSSWFKQINLLLIKPQRLLLHSTPNPLCLSPLYLYDSPRLWESARLNCGAQKAESFSNVGGLKRHLVRQVRVEAKPQNCNPLPLPHSSSINIPLIIILKWKRILCWSANLMNYGSRLLRLIIKTYFINIQVCHASNNERFRGGYFPCAS